MIEIIGAKPTFLKGLMIKCPICGADAQGLMGWFVKTVGYPIIQDTYNCPNGHKKKLESIRDSYEQKETLI